MQTDIDTEIPNVQATGQEYQVAPTYTTQTPPSLRRESASQGPKFNDERDGKLVLEEPAIQVEQISFSQNPESLSKELQGFQLALEAHAQVSESLATKMADPKTPKPEYSETIDNQTSDLNRLFRQIAPTQEIANRQPDTFVQFKQTQIELEGNHTFAILEPKKVGQTELQSNRQTNFKTDTILEGSTQRVFANQSRISLGRDQQGNSIFADISEYRGLDGITSYSITPSNNPEMMINCIQAIDPGQLKRMEVNARNGGAIVQPFTKRLNTKSDYNKGLHQYTRGLHLAEVPGVGVVVIKSESVFKPEPVRNADREATQFEDLRGVVTIATYNSNKT